MDTNSCSEKKMEIVRIEAYALDAITIPYGRSDRRVVDASKVVITGEPVVVSLREESATAGSSRQKDGAGPYYSLSLSWQTHDTSDDTLEQITLLETHPYHYIIYLYGGSRRLMYNENGFGESMASVSMQDEESATVAVSYQSRIPVLSLRE